MGFFTDYFSFPVFFLGNTGFSFFFFLLGKSLFFNFLFFKNYLPLKFVNFKFFPFFSFNFFLGSTLIYRNDFKFFYNSLFFFSSVTYSLFFDKFLNISFFLNFVIDALTLLNAYEVGCFLSVNSYSFIINNNVNNSLIYLLGTDSLLLEFKDSFLIYQGFFDTVFFFKSVFLFLPVSSFIERTCLFFNIEGSLRKSNFIFFPSFYSFSDSEIFRSFFYFKN